MSIIDRARAELNRIGFGATDTLAMVAVMRKFFDHFDSGGAVETALPVLERCLRGLPLTPLTGDDDEWADPMGDGVLLQNKRCSTLFKVPRDGRVFDVEKGTRVDIQFPYMPESKGLRTVIEVTPWARAGGSGS